MADCAAGCCSPSRWWGLICLNPSVLFSAALFALPALVQRWVEQPRRLAPDLLALSGAGLAAVALALPQLLGSLASTAGGGAVDWPADLNRARRWRSC